MNLKLLFKNSFMSLTIFLMTSDSFSQNVTNDELLTILQIKAFRVPSFPKKQWTIEILPDTLQKRKIVAIDKVLSSKTTSLVAVIDNDTTLSFTLIQNKNSSSQGTLPLKKKVAAITWNSFPEQLFKNTFVIATIDYEDDEDDKPGHRDLLVIQLIEELKF